MNQQPHNTPSSCPGMGTPQSGHASACDGCPFQSQCQSNTAPPKDPAISLIKSKLSSVKNIIIILSGKGGVGKSTISSQLALALALNQNLQIGILDVDICGPSIPHMLSIENEEVHQSNEGWTPVYKEDNLAVMSIAFLLSDKKAPVIWRGPRKNGLIQQFLSEVVWDALDYLIIDTPPGTSDEHMSLINYLSECNVKGVLIVTTPQEVALLDVRKEIGFCMKTNVNVIGVVENMSGFVCKHCGNVTEMFTPNTGGAEEMCKEFNLKLIAKIPLEPMVMQATEKGIGIVKEYPTSVTTIELKKIVDEVMK